MDPAVTVDARHHWVADKLAAVFDVPPHIAQGAVRAAWADVGALLDGGRDALTWFCQAQRLGGEAVLFSADAATTPATAAAAVLLRVAPAPVPVATPDAALAMVHLPAGQGASVGAILPSAQCAVSALAPAAAARLADTPADVTPTLTITTTTLPLALSQPDATLLSTLDARPLPLARLTAAGAAAVSPAAPALDHVRGWAASWLDALAKATAGEVAAPPTTSSAWPAAEVAWWRARAATLASAESAASAPAAVTALAVLGAVSPSDRAKLAAALADAAAAATAATGASACLATLDRSLSAALAGLAVASPSAEYQNEPPQPTTSASTTLTTLAARAFASPPALAALARDVATLLTLSRAHGSPPSAAAALVTAVAARVTDVLADGVGAADPLWDAPRAEAGAALASVAGAIDALCDALRRELTAAVVKTVVPSKPVRSTRPSAAPTAAPVPAPQLTPPLVDDALAPARRVAARARRVAARARRVAARARALADLLDADSQFGGLGKLAHVKGLPELAARAAALTRTVRARVGTAGLDAGTRHVDRDLLEAAVAVHALEGQALVRVCGFDGGHVFVSVSPSPPTTLSIRPQELVDAALAEAPTTEAAAAVLATVNAAARGAQLKVCGGGEREDEPSSNRRHVSSTLTPPSLLSPPSNCASPPCSPATPPTWTA